MENKNLELYSIVILIAIGLFAFFTGYSWGLGFIPSSADPLKELNKILSLIGTVLVACSLMISGLTYFSNFADKTLQIRKHLGIVGFWFILLHGVFSLFFLQRFFPLDYYFTSRNIISFLCALTSIILLIIMAVISNNWAMKALKPQTWRLILRYSGYVALILALYHFGVKNYLNWGSSFKFTILPDPTLIVFVIGSLAVLLRVALFISIKIKALNKKQLSSRA